MGSPCPRALWVQLIPSPRRDLPRVVPRDSDQFSRGSPGPLLQEPDAANGGHQRCSTAPSMVGSSWPRYRPISTFLLDQHCRIRTLRVLLSIPALETQLVPSPHRGAPPGAVPRVPANSPGTTGGFPQRTGCRRRGSCESSFHPSVQLVATE